jgi:hypothetical protein
MGMRGTVKIGTLLSFGMLSTLFFSLAYVFVDEAVPLTGPDDLFFLAESALCLGLALWSLITVVGIARKRKWARVFGRLGRPNGYTSLRSAAS